jgi:hypothetical protein
MDKKAVNEELDALFSECIWFENKDEAKASFVSLMNRVDELSKSPRDYEYYEIFATGLDSESKQIKRFNNLLVIQLLTGLWRGELTPIEVWQQAHDSTQVSSQTFTDCNIITVDVTDTGFKGGDAGHGCLVKFSIKDEASTCMFVNGMETGFFELELRGDSERRTFLNALKFAVDIIETNNK